MGRNSDDVKYSVGDVTGVGRWETAARNTEVGGDWNDDTSHSRGLA
jgi:hypothetical protein